MTRIAQSREKRLRKQKIYYRANKARIVARATAWNQADPHRRLNLLFLNKYDITHSQYLQMVKDQDNKCLICKTDGIALRAGRLYVDHCHQTGIVRGLLCDKCNRGLGCFNDNPDLMAAALDYLYIANSGLVEPKGGCGVPEVLPFSSE